MQVKGGYLNGTQSTRTHPIKHISISRSDKWNRISVKIGNTIITVGNTMTEVLIKLEVCESHIGLYINGKLHHMQSTLFEYDVEIDTDDSSIIQFIDDLVYDG